MSNPCLTSYCFHGTKRDLEIFKEKICEWTGENSNLKCIVEGAGLGHLLDQGLRCRGELVDIGDVESIDSDSGKITLSTETSWAPMPLMWVKVIESLNLGIKFTYYAEESGFEIYEIYDPEDYGDFVDVVYIDSYIKDEPALIFGYYDSIEEAVCELNEFFHTEYESLDEFEDTIDEYCQSHKDSYVNINIIDRINEIYDDLVE